MEWLWVIAIFVLVFVARRIMMFHSYKNAVASSAESLMMVFDKEAPSEYETAMPMVISHIKRYYVFPKKLDEDINRAAHEALFVSILQVIRSYAHAVELQNSSIYAFYNFENGKLMPSGEMLYYYLARTLNSSIKLGYAFNVETATDVYNSMLLYLLALPKKVDTGKYWYVAFYVKMLGVLRDGIENMPADEPAGEEGVPVAGPSPVVNPWANNSSGLVNEKASLDEPFRGEPEEQGEEKGSLNLPILFCRKCGNKLPENSKFCNVCGERIIMHEVKED